MSEPESSGSLSDLSQAHRAKEKERRSSLSAVRGSNSAFVQLLKAHNLDELKLSQKIVELDASQHTPMTGFQLLLKHNILSAPVWDPSQNQYIGFLDIKDLASSILFSIKTQRARAKALAAAAAAVVQDAVAPPDTVANVLCEEYTSEAMFHASKSPHHTPTNSSPNNHHHNENAFRSMSPHRPVSPHRERFASSPSAPHLLSPHHHLSSPNSHSPTSWDAHAERSIIKKFPREKPQAETDIHAVSQEPQLKYLARRHPFLPIAADATLYEAAKQLCGKVHRMPIVDENTGRVIKIVSQSMITAFLASHLDELGLEAFQTVEATGLGLKPVVSARGDRPAIEAFEEIDNHGLSGLGVVLRDGSIVGNTSSRDLRYFLLDRGALNLDMNLVDYLAAIRQKEVEVADHVPLCSVGPNGTIGRIIGLLAATKYHRIYVVDPRHNTPVGVVSHTDILKYITSAACTPISSTGLLKHSRTPSGTSTSGAGGFRSGRRLSLGSSFDFGSRNTSRSISPAPRPLSRSKSPAARPGQAVYCTSLYCWEYAPCLTHFDKLTPKKLAASRAEA